MATNFEKMVQSDERFEVAAERHLGMVVFRLKGPNELTEKILKKINSSGKIHCVPAALKVQTNADRRAFFVTQILNFLGKLRDSFHGDVIAHDDGRH